MNKGLSAIYLDEKEAKGIPPVIARKKIAKGYKSEREKLFEKYEKKLFINPDLSRSLVSFQSNKSTPFYRWLKYKEAFSHELVCYILKKFQHGNGKASRVLDPFAGAGTTLTTATKAGWEATGIELLPVGTAAMRARLLADTVDLDEFSKVLKKIEKIDLKKRNGKEKKFPHLRITEKAFSPKTEKALSCYLNFLQKIKDEKVRYLFWFAALSVLEDVSFTRKDGQYLRWDIRAGRNLKSNFSKGEIPEFKACVFEKLQMMQEDLKKRNGGTFSQNVNIIEGSCLNKLSELPDNHFDLVLTSPPYCNRYDYTRTYALELAFLGYGEKDIKELRQTLLSATVENKTKQKELEKFYEGRGKGVLLKKALRSFENQKALHEVLNILKKARENGELNNSNIPPMVENYFLEMGLVVWELARVLSTGGRVVMVNDNVQYHGQEVPLDLILSDIAVQAGLAVDAIWVLPKGKGNSSQQMDIHGRNELRKCVYIWSKPSGKGKTNGKSNGFHG